MRIFSPEWQSSRFWIAGLALLAMLLPLAMPSEYTAAAGTKTYKFTNIDTGNYSDDPASDIHIEFEEPVTWDKEDSDFTWQNPPGKFRDTNGSGTTNVNMAKGASGAGGGTVARNESVIFTFAFAGGEPPAVKQWFWTKDNDLDSKTGMLGNIPHIPEKGECTFDFASAVGDGQIAVSSGGQVLTFFTQAGESGLQAAARFRAEVEAQLNFAIASFFSPTTILIEGTAFGEPSEEAQITVIQEDSAGGPACGPVGGTTELVVSGNGGGGSYGWSVVASTALLGGLAFMIGGWFLRRRRAR